MIGGSSRLDRRVPVSKLKVALKRGVIVTELRIPLDMRALDTLTLGTDAAVAAYQEQRLKLEAARKARHSRQAADLAHPQRRKEDEIE